MKLAHALGPGAEFDVVRALVARWGDLAHGIGDDAAVVQAPPGEALLVSTDASVEDTHFRRSWLSPEEIGYRATASAYSDLAAMAATPIACVVALVVPEAWRDALPGLADGIGAATRDAGAHIVGGDLSRGAQLAITVTVFGSTASPIGRAGACVGDRVYVTGRLGGPLRALRALERGDAPTAADRARFAQPRARVREARWLAAHGATAMLDVSDGLAADLCHVAAASGVRLALDADAVPRVHGATPADALASGEEYELALTLPAAIELSAIQAAFEAAHGVPLACVGRVEALASGEAPDITVTGLRGERVDLPQGHDHFSR